MYFSTTARGWKNSVLISGVMTEKYPVDSKILNGLFSWYPEFFTSQINSSLILFIFNIFILIFLLLFQHLGISAHFKRNGNSNSVNPCDLISEQ